MKRFICFIICSLMLFSLVACGGRSDNNSTSPSSIERITTMDEDASEESIELSEEPIVYADDDVVNQFILDYNAITKSSFTGIRKGSIRTKYYAESYGYYCELINASDTNKICVTISETNENADIGVSGMRDVFHDIAKTIDPSLTDEQVYAHFDGLVSSNLLNEGDTFGTMGILYVPDRDLSSGHSRGHIEIKAK